jgi:hypothetical protein
MSKRTAAAALLTAVVVAALVAAPASAKAGKGLLFHDGAMVRTVVPPSAFPHVGDDPFFMVTNGVEGQLGIAGLAPGDRGYNGGHWAVYVVTFSDGTTPYLLTSDEAVMEAEAAGDVSVTRMPSADFLCPIQP